MDLTNQESAQQSRRTDLITLFLYGDVMIGRGIDQILFMAILHIMSKGLRSVRIDPSFTAAETF